MKRRWIIRKSNLTCENSACDSYGLYNACKLVKVEDDGSFVKVCRACKREVRREDMFRASEFKDRRACVNPKCKHVRDVTVSIFGQIHGSSDKTERWEKLCDACRLEDSAASHYAQAKKFFERAKQIRTKRKKIVDTESPRASA